MRPLLLFALLGACRSSTHPPPDDVGDDTDTDTDAAAVESDRPVDDPGTCLRPLPERSAFPDTWAELVEKAATTCLRTWSCDRSGAAHGAWTDECEGSREAFYDGEGARFAEVLHNDVEVCEGSHTGWFGVVVGDCPREDDRASAGCATPHLGGRLDLAACAGTVPEPAVLGQDRDAWADVVAASEEVCLGTVACPLEGAGEVRVLWQYAGCGVGRWDVFGADGARIGGSGHGAWPCVDGGALDEGQLASLSACVDDATFVPSAACGVAE